MNNSHADQNRGTYIPFYVDLSEKKILVAGSGPAALKALRTLSASGVSLFCLTDSDPVPPELSALCAAEAVTILNKAYEREDLYDMDYVICCLNDPRTVHDIFISCRTLGIRICVPGDPSHSDFFLEAPEETSAQNPSSRGSSCPETPENSSARAISGQDPQNLSPDPSDCSKDIDNAAGSRNVLPELTIYTDGSARGNPDGPGGYGAVLEFRGRDGQVHTREYSQGYRKTTNNRMELMAAIAALEALTRPCSIDLWSDSQYLIKAFNDHWIDGWIRKNWTRAGNEPVKNADLWKRLLAAAAPHRIRWHWVKGHDGNPGNERCDELATSAADSGNLIDDIPAE